MMGGGGGGVGGSTCREVARPNRLLSARVALTETWTCGRQVSGDRRKRGGGGSRPPNLAVLPNLAGDGSPPASNATRRALATAAGVAKPISLTSAAAGTQSRPFRLQVNLTSNFPKFKTAYLR